MGNAVISSIHPIYASSIVIGDLYVVIYWKSKKNISKYIISLYYIWKYLFGWLLFENNSNTCCHFFVDQSKIASMS